MRGLLSETVNHKFSVEGIALWVPTLEARQVVLGKPQAVSDAERNAGLVAYSFVKKSDGSILPVAKLLSSLSP
jgi:hypothetical protein